MTSAKNERDESQPANADIAPPEPSVAPSSASASRLPVFATAIQTNTFLARHALDVVKLIAPWMLVSALIFITLSAIVGRAEAQAFLYFLSLGLWQTTSDSASPVLVVLYLIYQVSFYTAIAINWHRFVLLREGPIFLNKPAASQMFPYFIDVVLIFLFITLTTAITGFFVTPLLSWMTDNISVSSSILVFVLACSLPVTLFNRLGLALPAIALKIEGASLSNAWAMTKGNGWRLTTAFLLGALPLFLIGFLIYVSVPKAVLPSFVAPAFLIVFSLIALLATVTFLSISYGFVFGERPIGTTAQESASAWMEISEKLSIEGDQNGPYPKQKSIPDEKVFNVGSHT